MIPIILMFLDLISLVSLTLIQFKVPIAFQLPIMSAIYLIAKGFMFRDIMSIIDLLCGAYLIAAFIFGISSFIYWIILAWFMYKLIFVVIFNIGSFT